MKTMNRFVAVLACLLLSAALFGTQGYLDFTRPAFDPAPWVSAFSANRQTVISSIDDQNYEDSGWVDNYRFTAEYDNQRRLSVQNMLIYDQNQGWVPSFTMNIIYRPDNRPLRVDMNALIDGVWQPCGVLDYIYQDAQLRMIRYDQITDEGRVAYWQSAFYYLPTTQILDTVMEIYYDESQAPNFFRKYEYIFDSGNRPFEIISSVMSGLNDWSVENRRTFVYHNDDQTTYAVYMHQLEFGWPMLTRFITGPQPTKLVEQRKWSQYASSTNWLETNRDFYIYDEANLLQRVDSYTHMGTGEWVVNRQQTYSYENSLPIIETFWENNVASNELQPSYRSVYGYSQITAEEDPIAAPAQINLQVHPNPFNPMARISYKLENSLPTDVCVYNLKGQKVRTLFQGKAHAGDNNLNWDGRDNKGQELPAGIYLIRLEAGNQSKTVKAVLSK